MKDVLLFSTGLHNNKELDKPVKYNEEFLKELARYSEVPLTEEHKDKIIGKITNIKYEDGKLMGDVDDSYLKKGYGFSPTINTSLEDMGEYYQPNLNLVNLLDISRTKFPVDRRTILANSEDNSKNEDDTMTEDLNNVLKENGSLKQQINDKVKLEESLKKEKNELSNELQSKDKLIEELEAQIKDNESKSEKKIKEYEAKLNSYAEKEKEAKMTLVMEVANAHIKEDEDNRDELLKEMCEDLINLPEATLNRMKDQAKPKEEDNEYKGVPSTLQESDDFINPKKESKSSEINWHSSGEDIEASLRAKGIRF